MVEIFQFVVDKLESYYRRRILCIAHNRIDQYIQVKFRGLHAGRIFKEDIRSVLEDKDQFLVKSGQDSLTEYRVDMNIGTCSCVAGKDGSPCSHQLAVAINFHRVSLNCIPTFHSSTRRQLACIAMEVKQKVIYPSCKLQLQEGGSMALKENHPLLLEDLLTINRKKM